MSKVPLSILKAQEEVADRQQRKATVTSNIVAMMEPKAAAAMKELAKRTGGQFSMVEKGGKVKVMKLD